MSSIFLHAAHRCPPRSRRAAVAARFVIAAVIAVLVPLTTGCGPSQLARQYDVYAAQVDPLLEQEAARWRRIGALTRERAENYALPRYYDYLQQTALPFYEGFQEELAAIRPEDDRLVAAHEALTRFVAARLDLVRTEIASRGLLERAYGEGGLLDVRSGLEEAENLRYEYMETVKDDGPDAKLGELYSAVASFRSKYFDPLEQGAIDPEDVQVRLRQHVIPSLEALARRKYTDDEKGRLLKACVVAWLEWHRTVVRACPLLEEVWQAKAATAAATNDAAENLRSFLDGLAKIRAER